MKLILIVIALSTSVLRAHDCSCTIEVSEPKAFPGPNCPKGYLATGVDSIRPPRINCSKIEHKCDACPAPVSESYLPFALPDMNAGGAMYRSEDRKNAVYVLETFFLGCPYCHQNSPNVHELAESYKSEPRVQILDVGIDRQDGQYEAWIRAHKCQHPVLKDANRELVRRLGTQSYPSTYILNCRGELVYSSTGVWYQDTKRRIKMAVDKALETKCE